MPDINPKRIEYVESWVCQLATTYLKTVSLCFHRNIVPGGIWIILFIICFRLKDYLFPVFNETLSGILCNGATSWGGRLGGGEDSSLVESIITYHIEWSWTIGEDDFTNRYINLHSIRRNFEVLSLLQRTRETREKHTQNQKGAFFYHNPAATIAEWNDEMDEKKLHRIYYELCKTPKNLNRCIQHFKCRHCTLFHLKQMYPSRGRTLQ